MGKIDKNIGKFFYKVGKKMIVGINYVGGLSSLTARSFYFAFRPPINVGQIFQQANFVGVNSFFIVSLVSLFTGVVLALQSAYALQKFSGELYVAGLVALSMTRELGPVLTALVIAGRVGAAISAELGTMKVTEQIDALETLATNPVRYLVTPRLIALMIMLPILTVYADLIGMLGGYLVAVFKLGIGHSMYIKMTFDSLVLKDVFTGLFKSFFFGIIVAIVGCYEGLITEGGAEGVGKSTTLAVVISFVLIIASDCLFTAFFYFVIG